jgi:DNA polymerase-4
MERSIIHLNIADFAVAVETNHQPSLRGYPLIIAPQGAPRAVVYDMSEEAFQQGIRKGMPLARACRINKKIPILPPSFYRYEQVMKGLLKETFAFTPLIESGTADGHIFLDVTASGRLFGPSVDVAFQLKKIFKKMFNLDPIWSVAANKLIAKVATRIVKPVGEYIVAPGEEADFLAPLPIHLIPGIDPLDLKRLKEFNLFTVSEARVLTLEQLKIPFQRRAHLIHDRIRGIDPTPVAKLCAPCPGADHEFSNDTNDMDVLRGALYLMIETLCRDLRNRHRMGSALTLILSYSDGVQTVSTTPLPATANDMIMFKSCTDLLDKTWTRRVRIRHMRLVCKKSTPAVVQTELFSQDTKTSRQAGLIRAMDRIREQFGRRAISPALTLIPGTGTA